MNFLEALSCRRHFACVILKLTNQKGKLLERVGRKTVSLSRSVLDDMAVWLP